MRACPRPSAGRTLPQREPSTVVVERLQTIPEAGTPIPASARYPAFVSLAMCDAVVKIAGAMNALVCLGIQFRFSMRSANELGHQVADWAVADFFRPEAETPPTVRA